MKTCVQFLRVICISLILLPVTPSLAGDIMIENAWIREMPHGAEVAAGYLDITNHGTVADRLIRAEATGAMSAMLHQMTTDDNGVMRMRHLEGIDIAPGETLSLAPGGYHLMIVGVKEPYEAHSDIEVTLTFEHAGAITTPFFVGQHARSEHDAAHSPTMNHEQGHNMEQMQHDQNHEQTTDD